MGSFSLLLEWLEIPPWYYFLGLMIAVFVSVYLYFKSRKVRSPCYAIYSFNIITDLVGKIKPLEMLYSGQRIENLTASKILFWNAGRETINSQDVASADPITLRAKNGCRILDASILQVKEPANQFSIPSFDQSRVLLHFDYIDKDQGVVIQILHTGKSGEDLELQGTIKGAGKLIRRFPPIAPPRYQKQSIVQNTVSYVSTVLTGVIIAAIWMLPRSSENLYLLGLLSMLLFVDILIIIELFKSRIPKGFESFKQEF